MFSLLLKDLKFLLLFQVDSLFCSLSIQINERTVKRFKLFGESSHFLNFALSVSPWHAKKSGELITLRHIVCIEKLMNINTFLSAL